MTKADATRKRLLDRALKLFQKKGVEATTMRDIAKAAGLSLGAAYYYFPSKEALVFAYYDQTQALVENLRLAGTPREQLGMVFHAKLESIRPHRKMLVSILPRLVNPADELSAFSDDTREIRERGIAQLELALAGAKLDKPTLSLVTHALWLLQLALMLVYINDASPHQKRTHGLADDALDMLVPMLPMLATPMGRALCERVVGSLHRAGIGVV